MPGLFDPVKIGAWNLPNRIIMAPLTRTRAGKERVPNELMAEYYAQRASAGMIISEATSVTPMGVGIMGGCSFENIGNGTMRVVSGHVVSETAF